MTTKVGYFNIDKDDLTISFGANRDDVMLRSHDADVIEDARFNARYSPSYQRTTVKVEVDNDGNLSFTPVEAPNPKYWIRQGRSVAYALNTVTHRDAAMFTHFYREDDNGNLLKVDDDEKARAIEAWKNS